MILDKIVNVEVIPISIPLTKPMYMNSRCLTMADNVIIKIELASGIVGWGETASAPKMTGELQSTITTVINRVFIPLLLDQDINDYKTILAKMNRAIYTNPGAKSAVCIALLDALAKVYGCTVAEILGPIERTTFDSIVILGNKTWEENIIDAIELQHQGTSWFKIKVASSDIQEDIDGTLELRKQLGAGAVICADANSGLTFNDTKKYILQTQDANLKFFEQPLNNIEDMALAQKLPALLCMDEFVFDLNDLYYIASLDAARGINLKNVKLGGPINVVEGARICSELGLAINLSGKVSETSIATAALLHCAAVVPNLNWGLSVTNNYLEADVTKAPVGAFLPSQPGLGIDVDECVLQHYKVIL